MNVSPRNSLFFNSWGAWDIRTPSPLFITFSISDIESGLLLIAIIGVYMFKEMFYKIKEKTY
jgi:hypothetical protein